MEKQQSRIGKFVHWIAPNAIWDVIKWLGGSSMMTSIGRLCWLEFHRSPVDWYWLAALFLVGIILTLIGVLCQHRKESHSAAESDTAAQAKTNSVGSEAPALHMLSFTPLQTEIFQLVRDLRKLLKDAGPAPVLETKYPGPISKTANAQARQVREELIQIETNEWMNKHSEWARKIIYRYREQFSDRVKKFRDSLGASTGMVVVPLDPYTTDIRPEEFKDLIGVLLNFFVELEKRKDMPEIQTLQILSKTSENTAGPRLEVSSSTTLRFEDVIPNAYVFLVEIKNTEIRFENTARNVSAAIEFEPIKGEVLKGEGAWKYACPGSCDKWTRQIPIYMGRAACLPLFFWFQASRPFKYYQLDARKLIINHHGLLTGTKDFDLLGLGEWTIRIRLSGDNIDEAFHLTVNLSPDQGPRLIC